MDWRSYKITRIRIFEGRSVGDLSRSELARLAPWLEKVQKNWDRADEELRNHCAMIRRAIKAIEMESETPQQLLEPTASWQQSLGLQLHPPPLSPRSEAIPEISPPPPTPVQAKSVVAQTDRAVTACPPVEQMLEGAKHPGRLSVSRKDEQQHERLASSEQSRLAELERTIEAGLATFVEIGSALSEIRDKRLYRQTHPTFEAYCQRKWAIAARRARQLIGAAEVVSNLKDESVTGVTIPTGEKHVRIGTGVPILTHEKHVRPLVGLGAKEQRQVWQRAVEAAQGAPSEQHVRKIRDAMFPKCKPAKHKSQPRRKDDLARDKPQDVPQEPVEVESKATRQDCVKALFTFIEVLANSTDEPFDAALLASQNLDTAKFRAVLPKLKALVIAVRDFAMPLPKA